jgi:hypothetical protein
MFRPRQAPQDHFNSNGGRVSVACERRPPAEILGIVLMFKGLRDPCTHFPIASVPAHWHKGHKRRFAGGHASPSQGLALVYHLQGSCLRGVT